jgi:hypothetical protein
MVPISVGSSNFQKRPLDSPFEAPKRLFHDPIWKKFVDGLTSSLRMGTFIVENPVVPETNKAI